VRLDPEVERGTRNRLLAPTGTDDVSLGGRDAAGQVEPFHTGLPDICSSSVLAVGGSRCDRASHGAGRSDVAGKRALIDARDPHHAMSGEVSFE
jgi:hypothetical protein